MESNKHLLGLIYFFKVSPALNLGKKISPTAISGLEPQNLLKFCPEYCYIKKWF
jgi:hypothetical protein